MPVLMPSPVFRWFVPAQNGTGLVPAAGYIAAFYSAGTDIAKTIYHPNGAPYASPANEATLNSEGYAEIWLGAGSYKLRVLNPDRAEIYTLDNITGAGSFGTGFVETVQPTDSAPTFGPNGLAQLDPAANKFTWVSGYWAVGDGGHGFFWNETSSEADDTGYVIASAIDGTKRWFRVQDEDGSVRAASFGYVGNRAEDLSTELLAASAYASGQIKRLVIGPGNAATISTTEEGFALYALGGLYLEPGSMITGDGSFENLFITGYVSGSAEQHFTDCQPLFETPQMNENPEWFGSNVSLLDNTAAFSNWFASQAAAFTLPPGVWKYANTTAFPYPNAPFILLGSIEATTGSDIPSGYHGTADSRYHIGALDVVGEMTGGASIALQSNVIAGGGAAGLLKARAGTGSRIYAASGQYGAVIDVAQTVGTGEEDLLSTGLSGGTLFIAGDRICIAAVGNYQAASGVKTVKLKIGSVTVVTATITDTTGWWRLEVSIYCAGSGNFKYDSQFLLSAASSAHSPQIISGALTGIDFTVSNTILITGQAAAGFIANDILNIDFYPAN